jgi:hypothetical protein
MAPKIGEKLAEHINSLCLSEERADVHFALPTSMEDLNVIQVSLFIIYSLFAAKNQLKIYKNNRIHKRSFFL